MLVIAWERAWLAMWRIQAEEFIRSYNIAVLASPGADPFERDRMLGDQQRQMALPQQPGSVRRFGRWIQNVARELFGSV